MSLSARIQAGATGPVLEEQLGAHGLTLRHFPQSFQFSTLGGWIATRAGGHFATLYTHIDDLVESVRALTPIGVWESRRLPGSGAGVSPDRMLIGSEGTLGVITEAWVRVRPRPTHRASAAVRFERVHGGRGGGQGALAIRAVSRQLPPDRCPRGRGDRRRRRVARAARARVRVGRPRRRALDDDGAQCCGDHGGTWERRAPAAGPASARPSAAGARRSCALPTCAMCSSRSECCRRRSRPRSPGSASRRFHERVIADVSDALREVCGGGTVTCRFTHVYPDGPAPYYTILAPARRGAGARAVVRAQKRRVRGGDRRRRHDHPPPRDRARAPPLV